MSGHSKWSTIKRQKGVADAKRSALFSKLAKQIMLAARDGKDPGMNVKLRLAIDRAKASNMPSANIDRAIKSGAGEDTGSGMKEATYEGFGPGNVAILVVALTDNPNRTSSDVRALFSKHGGALGSANSVAWMFQQRGLFRLSLAALGDRQEQIQLDLIDAGADDVQEQDGQLVVTTKPNKFAAVRDWLLEKSISPTDADLAFVPQSETEIDDHSRQQLYSLLSALDEHDDVTALYSNEA